MGKITGYFTGGGIYTADNVSLTLVNSILWKNTPYEMSLDNRFVPTSTVIDHSDIEGGMDSVYQHGAGSISWLAGNITANPLFTNEGQDFTLSPGSPCVNAGKPDTTTLNVPPYDLRNLPRIVDTIDMGAYEYQSITGIDEVASASGAYRLADAYPNPFNPTTTIGFDLPERSAVSMVVYNVLGQKVSELVSGVKEAGYHNAVWNATGVASGAYLVRFTATDASGIARLNRVKKLLIAK